MTKTIANERENERIDQLFNADLISSIVPLSGDSLTLFMQRYRPSAVQINGWTMYMMRTFTLRSAPIRLKSERGEAQREKETPMILNRIHGGEPPI